MPTIKDQFRNDSGGVAGAVVFSERGDRLGLAVQPGDTVWLSEEEQAVTANAPRDPDDNPFINGTFSLVTEGKEIRNARPLRPPPTETGAGPLPAGEAEQGVRAPAEEVATPQAVPTEHGPEEAAAQPTRKRPAK